MNFPPHIPRSELEASETAARRGIDNSIPDALIPNAIRIAWFLETLRAKLKDHFGKTMFIIITSGYRSPMLNTAVGGSYKSTHCRALAADVRVPGMTPYRLACFIRDNMVEEGFDQVIHEFGSWVHIGLSEGIMRQELLTAMKINKKTVYKSGILEVAA